MREPEGVWALLAHNEQAKAVNLASGRCDHRLSLTPAGSRIGRMVSGEGAMRFPTSVAQVSGKHAVVRSELLLDGSRTWIVEDTSTNGTYVNGHRVPKGGSLPLPEGAILRLSTTTSGGVSQPLPCNSLEGRL